MYCLDCGSKIEDGESQCPNCGLSVSEMRARLAEAEEKLVYSDAVPQGPVGQTSKLPLVSERTYVDAQGEPLDPADEVDVAGLTRDPADLTAIPEIGDDDPFVTMPMPRIVSDTGKVVADADRTAKEYRQPEPRRPIPVKLLIAACVAVAVCVGVYACLPQISALLPQVQTDDPASNVENSDTSADPAPTSDTDARTTFENDLAKSYSDLGSWRAQVDDVVNGLEGYYRVTNRDTRSGYADQCSGLIETITESQQALADSADNAQVSSDATLNDAYQRIDELYGCLLTRLGVVYQCWEISLSYDNPRNHDSEILAPLKQDIKGGSSASEAQFDSLYPEADPSSLSAAQ